MASTACANFYTEKHMFRPHWKRYLPVCQLYDPERFSGSYSWQRLLRFFNKQHVRCLWECR